MTSVRLYVLQTTTSVPNSSSVIVERYRNSPGAGSHSILTTTPAQLQDEGAAAEEDFVAIANLVTPEAVDAMMDYLDGGAAADAVIIQQQNAIPLTLLNTFPADVHGLLQRPTENDILCVRRPLIDSADLQAPLLALWLQCGALSRFVSGRPDVDRFPEIGPGRPIVPAQQLMTALQNCDSVRELEPHARDCFTAGVLLLWDCLEDSHQVSQSAEGSGGPRTADYWHGIMHRREPDLGNAGYWFRRVGRHQAMERLGTNLNNWLTELGYSGGVQDANVWDPDAMIRRCGSALKAPDAAETAVLRATQYLEMLNLLAEPWWTPER